MRASERDDLPDALFEGIWYKWSCPECDSMNETEEDIRGDVVECEVCGAESAVRGS